MKILIKNGLIADGSLNKPFKGNVLIENNKIKKIGIIDEKVNKVIDARDRIVSPGFIRYS